MGEEAEKPKPVAEFSGLWVEDEDDFVEFAHYAQAEALTSTEVLATKWSYFMQCYFKHFQHMPVTFFFTLWHRNTNEALKKPHIK